MGLLQQVSAIPLAFTGGQWAVILTLLAVGLALHVGLVLWLHRDVRATGKDPRWWTAVAAIAYIPTLIAWRFVRPKPVRPAPGPRPQGVALTDDEERPRNGKEDPYPLGVRAAAMDRPRHDAVRTVLQEDRGGVTARVQRVSCPRCAAQFEARRHPEGPTRVDCPGCGAVGHV